MRRLVPVAILGLLVAIAASWAPEAPSGFDDESNGVVDDSTHRVDKATFDEVEGVANGLGPLYNAQSCRECHQNPVSGASSQVTELRVGHEDQERRFHNPEIPIANGAAVISGRSLVNDRAICPNAAFPTDEIQERVPSSESIRTLRLSVSLLGDGFVEAVADQTLIDGAERQCRASSGKICGQVIHVPIVEAPGQMGVGRFGWKDQQASLLSFAADAYLNEMGVTSRLQPDEVTALCNTASEPNDSTASNGVADIDRFARFVRATKVPGRDSRLAAEATTVEGARLFADIGCATCHVATMTTAPTGTAINGGIYTIPAALGSVVFHPYSDFLMHDVGTGDGILQATREHYGRRVFALMTDYLAKQNVRSSRNKIRTAPLWGLRFRSRLMHDGASLTLPDAIARHGGEASDVVERFQRLDSADRDAVLHFLLSL